ncbi:MAG: ferritin-like domain-containing protein [Nocardioidaceae bacterium]|nr:ferritin-like domain-containing protein [Nocardioidaceae bacterium]NUS51657.1 ferritin-like domain-containing protein [Nocardioidaceae bacterium]
MTPLQALQRTLAGEHAAVYVYGVLGGRVSLSREPELAGLLSTAYVVHRGRRDQLTAMVRAKGGDPVAAEVSYELPNAATTQAQLRSAALVTERRCSATYADMAGSTSRADRRWAVDALTDTAVRELGFGGRPDAYPGVAEL